MPTLNSSSHFFSLKFNCLSFVGLSPLSQPLILTPLLFLFFYFQNHIEKIVEKPVSQSSLHAPLSRRQSHNVNVEDIIAQQVGRLFLCFVDERSRKLEHHLIMGLTFPLNGRNIREYLMRCGDALFFFVARTFWSKGNILLFFGGGWFAASCGRMKWK